MLLQEVFTGRCRGRRFRRAAAATFGALLLVACGGGGSGGSPGSNNDQNPQQSASNGSGPPPVEPPAESRNFVDVTAASGIAYSIGYSGYLPMADTVQLVSAFATGGVAAGDYDSDGDIDLFITRGDIGANLLFRNNGSGVFTDVATAAGLAYTATSTENYRHSGPTFADMDGDGDLDLFIGGLFGDPSFIYRNNGDGTFTDVTAGSGIDTLEAEYSISAAFGDYDLDGDLDLFIAHWGTIRGAGTGIVGDTEHLWRNDSDSGGIVFTSVSAPAGVAPSILTLPDPGRAGTPGEELPHEVYGWTDFTFTPTFARIDDDLYPDVLSVADFNLTMLFLNNRDGTFTNATDTSVLTDRNGMGSAVGDYDNDGDLDWFVSAIDRTGLIDRGNRFYENDNGTLIDRTDDLAVREGGWGWGACFMDFENDGDLDLYHTNGWSLEGLIYAADESRAFVGSGGGPFFERASELGLNDSAEGRGVVCADFDNDGDVDIFQLHRGTPVAATLWRNDSAGNNYLTVRLNGAAPNTEAAGARIFLTVGDTTQMREITIGSNFVSQNPAVQVFGLGTATQADELRVQWPDGVETVDTAVAAGQVFVRDYPGL